MDTTTAPAIETSPQSNLEVISPVTSTDSGADMDWASRLDSAMDQINKDTGATKYGKPDDAKTASDMKVEKAKSEKVVKEKATKVSVKKAPEVAISKEAEAPDKEEDKGEEESKSENSSGDLKEETPRGLTEKAAVKWGELRAEAAKAKEYAKEVETLKAELEKAKTTPVDSEEVEKLRKINSEYEQELSIARVEATQEYKSNVVDPMVNVVGYLNGLASKYELSSKEMLTAFAEADPSRQSDMIADIAASMNERDRLRFYASADDYAEIIRRRDMYQSNSRDRMAQIEQQRQAELSKQQAEAEKSLTESKQAYEKATSKVFEDLKKTVPVLSDEEVAADVQRLAKGDYSSADPELKAYLAHSGALLPHILKALREAKSELDAANKKIVGYRNGSPKAGGGSSESTRNVPDDVGFLEALDQQLG